MFYICIFSNKFDLKQTIRVLHTGVQQFLRNPTPWPCITQINKSEYKVSRTHNTTCYYVITFRKNRGVRKCNQEKRQWRATETRICVFTVSASTTDRRIAEPGFKMDSPVWIPEEENTGQDDTLIKKQLKNLSHQFRRSQITSHLWWEADRCWHKSYSIYVWPH